MVVSKHQSSREFQTFMMPKLCDFCLLKAITIDICQTEPWVGTWNSLTSDSVCLEEHDFFYWWVQDVKQNNHFWFCLLRGTWLFLLMGSRCQTKNLQAVLTLDAMQDLCSTAANVQYAIQSFYGIQSFYCLALQRSHFPSCAGHEKQLLAEQNGEIIVQDAGRPSRAGSRCQTFHRANRWVTFDSWFKMPNFPQGKQVSDFWHKKQLVEWHQEATSTRILPVVVKLLIRQTDWDSALSLAISEDMAKGAHFGHVLWETFGKLVSMAKHGDEQMCDRDGVTRRHGMELT